jgi:hypothetical protein
MDTGGFGAAAVPAAAVPSALATEATKTTTASEMICITLCWLKSVVRFVNAIDMELLFI